MNVLKLLGMHEAILESSGSCMLVCTRLISNLSLFTGWIAPE